MQNNLIEEYERRRAKLIGVRGGYWLILAAIFVSLGAIYKIVNLQNTTDTSGMKKYVESEYYRNREVEAARGNLYAADGSILATTVMRYDIHLDITVPKNEVYDKNVDALSDSLGKMFDKPKYYYRKILNDLREKKDRYYTLKRNLDYDQYNRLRNFPIFKLGKSKGGMIVERRYKREFATTKIGRGTLGMDDERGKAGLEGAFSDYLSGTPGSRHEKRVGYNQWKPIDFWNEKKPIDGEDVYTTLDLRIQDIVYSALEKQLINYNAQNGTVIVMEVETGKIKAMVNLQKNKDGAYEDAYNYAMKDRIEPGSTFKVVSLLAAMDDGFIDENTKVNIGGGVWNYAGQRITDGHGGGTYEISDVLAKSSNVGTAKLITKYYASKPNIFFDHLKRWKLFDKMEIELPGITTPKFVTPDDKRWNKATLASISYGYSSGISILQLTTFYNAIANGGKMLKPLFIEKRMKDGAVLYEAQPEVMVDKIASDKAIKMMTDALTKAVEKGTARSIFTPNLKMAGKTGTARFEYWKKGPMKYRASFAGFYPSDKPKYTCYVMISEPDNAKGYYGGTVAAPVFKEIAGRTFLKTPQNIEKDLLVNKK
ncbi:MAG: penicillin-binding protein 2, partial [Bergeyella zoohelcum]|nr:penicillin-binding protein 2 [Bergeyella zoohelcum]